MNLSEMRDAVLRVLSFDATDTTDLYLNWAQDEILNRTKWSWTERTVGDSEVAIDDSAVYCVAGTNALIPDFNGLIDLGIIVDEGPKHKLFYVKPQVFDMLTFARDATGDPSIYTVVGGVSTPVFQTDFEDPNANLLFTAVNASGTNVIIHLVDPGTTHSLSIAVVDTTITITLGWATSAVTSTAANVIAIINGSGSATALLTPSLAPGAAGAGLVEAVGPVNLSDGGPITNVLVYPTPSDSGFLIPRYYRNTDSHRMVDDDDEPIVPVFLHQALIQLAIATGLLAFDQEAEAQLVQAKADAIIGKALVSDIAMRAGDATALELKPVITNPADPHSINPAGGSAQTPPN